MNPAPVVSTASPLIALKQIGQFDLLERHLTPVLVLPAGVLVAKEGL
jgi:hypothetical protein